MDGQLQAVILAEGHIPHDVQFPAHARDDNGWGYVVRIGSQVLFCHGTTPHSVLRQITSSYTLEVFAQLMAVLALAERLPPNWLAFIDNTSGDAALKKGYGNDAIVNGMLATFRGTAARCGWRPHFAKANVADAIFRGDLSRASQEGWTRLDDHTDAITDILTMAASDADYANNQAVYDLENAIN